MTLDEIVAEWATDAKIDPTDLFTESLDRVKLHAKYIKILVGEKKALWTLKKEYKALRRDKKEFLSNPTKEFFDRGWKLPPQGRLTVKAAIDDFLAGDPDMIDLEIKIGIQEEKEEILKSILNEIKASGYDIKNALHDRQYMAGG